MTDTPVFWINYPESILWTDSVARDVPNSLKSRQAFYEYEAQDRSRQLIKLVFLDLRSDTLHLYISLIFYGSSTREDKRRNRSVARNSFSFASELIYSIVDIFLNSAFLSMRRI